MTYANWTQRGLSTAVASRGDRAGDLQSKRQNGIVASFVESLRGLVPRPETR